MELQLTVPGNKTKKKVEVSDTVFAKDFNEPLVHQVVTAYLAGARTGNAAQKTRAEVRGGGKKPWRQKGTGNARAGTIRSPIWRGGGKTFAAKKQDYSQKVNKKMYRAALCAILSELVRQDRLIVTESFEIAEPKTKVMAAKLKEFDVQNALIVTEEVNGNLYLSVGNIPHIDVRDVEGIDPVALIKYEKVIITQAALKKIEERLA